MRFCFPTTFYPPYSFGGDGISVQALARALVKRGHEVTVVHDADAYLTLHDGPVPEADGIDDGVNVIALRSWGRALSPLMTQQTARPVFNGARLKQLLGDSLYDVIHYHNVSLIGGPAIFAIGTSAAKVYTAHEHWLVCPTHVLWRHNRERCDRRECIRCQMAYKRPPQLWRLGGAMNSSLRHIQLFIALSEFSRAKHLEFGFPREMSVLPPFVEDAPAVAQSQSRSPHPRPYFFFAGRLERVKGIHDAIQAFDRYDGADLLIAGEGNEEAALKAAASGNTRCVFLGRLSSQELRRYYRHAIATLVPSVGFETFGIVMIESFRESTPVIARSIGPFPESITSSGGGELFETQDQLVDALRRLQSDPAYARALGCAGRNAYCQRWTEEQVIPQYVALVQDTIASRQ